MKYQDYNKISAVTAHGLMEFWKSPWHYYQKYILGKREMDFAVESASLLGNVADCLLTAPDDFEELYMVMDTKAIGGKTGKVIMWLAEKDFAGMMTFDDFSDEDIQELCDKAGIAGGAQWFKSRAKSDKFAKKYKEFYDHLIECIQTRKTVITEDIFEKAKEIQVRMLSDKFVGSYFRNDFTTHKVYYQVPVFFNYMGLQCKCLYDLVVIPTDGRSCSISDLKTTSQGISRYNQVVLKDKLFIQAGYYSLPHIRELKIETPVKELQDVINNNNAYLHDFSFIVADTVGSEAPTEYSMGGLNSPQLVQVLNGGILGDGERFPGLDVMMNNLKWHYDNNLWEHTREYYEGKQAKLQIFK